MNERRWTTPLLLGVVVVLSMLVGGLVATRSAGHTVAPAAAARADATTLSPIAAFAATPGIADVVDRSKPSAVLITGTNSSGSGLVVDKEGNIVTNYHVVEGQTTLKVTLADGTASVARVLGTDPGTDLAVIKAVFLPEKLVPAKLGDSDLMRPGDAVFAIGSPFDQPFTVTSGIISAIGRTTQSSFTGRSIRDVLQIDAAVNPGNSGGPLFNLDGEVVGINSSIENPSGRFFVGLGFAIPSNAVKRFLPALIAGQEIKHPQLGVSVLALDAVIAGDLGITTERGVYVTTVQPASAAARAGIVASGGVIRGTRTPTKGGDVITSINGQPVMNFRDLARAIDTADVGSAVRIVVERNGQQLTLSATLQPWDMTAR
ncbi:MAG: PDZ domain-containing protein [Dehalococcoidia bacterium]|nr:PDZ domain-containing protein [Dehalococcoidia bacterium]